MIRMSELIIVIFLFFISSAAFFLIFVNIGVSNDSLSVQSIQDIQNLNAYHQNISNPFADNVSLNYSLTDYSNTDQFSQSNIETKGALESILDIFGDNKLSAFNAPLNLALTLSPLPSEAFSWTTAMIGSFIGIIIFIAFIAAWKAGLF